KLSFMEDLMNLKKCIQMVVPIVLLGSVLSAKENKNTLTNVPTANPRIAGVTSANILSPELIEVAAGQGSMRMENTSALTSYYGYDNDVPATSPDVPRMLPVPNAAPVSGKVEATKTEPDKNTYLILKGQDGADPKYDYGKHFLFQGHEVGV